MLLKYSSGKGSTVRPWATDESAKRSVVTNRQPTLSEYFEEESESSVIELAIKIEESEYGASK